MTTINFSVTAENFEEFASVLNAFVGKMSSERAVPAAESNPVKPEPTSDTGAVTERKPRKQKETAVDPGDKEPEVKAETKSKYTLDSLREYLAEINRAGHKDKVLAIIKSHGVKALGELDAALYETVAAEAGKLLEADDALNM